MQRRFLSLRFVAVLQSLIFVPQANAPDPLLRQFTEDIVVERFELMTSWENSDHPVCMFYQNR